MFLAPSVLTRFHHVPFDTNSPDSLRGSPEVPVNNLGWTHLVSHHADPSKKRPEAEGAKSTAAFTSAGRWGEMRGFPGPAVSSMAEHLCLGES